MKAAFWGGFFHLNGDTFCLSENTFHFTLNTFQIGLNTFHLRRFTFKCRKKEDGPEKDHPLSIYSTLAAAIISKIHPAMNAKPPIGVTAPRMLIPVRLNTYKLPEKMTIPASIR
jgi:hypothetical protein